LEFECVGSATASRRLSHARIAPSRGAESRFHERLAARREPVARVERHRMRLAR
jgi:hypothetical protein